MESTADTYVNVTRLAETENVSIGIDLTPNGACPFACDYCEVSRGSPPPFPEHIDLATLETRVRSALLRHAADAGDVVFAGSGEPTWSPQFEDAVAITRACVRCLATHAVPIRVLTCGSKLEREPVATPLKEMVYAGEGEVWVKLDAWDEESFHRINGSQGFDRVMDSVLAFARRVPIVLQTLVAHRRAGLPMKETGARLAGAIRALVDRGAQVERVELTTVLRPPGNHRWATVGPVSASELASVSIAIAQVAPIRVLDDARSVPRL